MERLNNIINIIVKKTSSLTPEAQ